MGIRMRPIFLVGVGVGGRGGYLSLGDKRRVADGNGKWGEWHVFWHRCGACPCVYTPNAQSFVENSNVREKHQKNFDPLTRPPSRPLAAGPSIWHLSLVTRRAVWFGLVWVNPLPRTPRPTVSPTVPARLDGVGRSRLPRSQGVPDC